jgi:hypothetical protein
MPQRSLRSRALSAFACWLVLLASADDFNLVRLALPPSAADSEGPLPLDDPNTDFTESSPSRQPLTTSRHRFSCTTSVAQSLTRPALTSPLAAPALGHTPRPGGNAPLRC